MTTTNQCDLCQDTGRAVDHFSGRFTPCPRCQRENTNLAAGLAVAASLSITVLVVVMVLVAWFGDLHSIPLIGK